MKKQEKRRIGKVLLAQLKPKDKAYEVADAELPGFILRVQPSGVMTYYARFRRKEDGTRGRVQIGPTILMTPTQARDKALAILGEAARGGDPSAKKKKQEQKAHTLKTFLDEVYGPFVEGNKKTGLTRVAVIKSAFPTLLDAPLTKITALSIEKWRSERMGKTPKPKPATVNRPISALKAALNRAVEWKLLPENPLHTVRALKEDARSKVRYLEAAEYKRLMDALDAREVELRRGRKSANKGRRLRGYEELPDLTTVTYADYLKPMVILSLNTGLRRGELFNLTWQDVDLGRRMLTVRGEGAKTSTTRHVPLNSTALDVLKAWQKQTSAEGLVFKSDQSTSGRFDNVNTAWQAVRHTAKLDDFRWHDMRHDFASKLVMAGVDLNTVRELLGHSDIQMTLRYAHLAPHVKADAVERIVRAGAASSARAEAQ
ncbi:MAG: site-specific integrase [Candidatus Hydrogenedentes bacterium]|nr:site-specific integrase [Candidatus Hydrogenedentota bacterium]